VRPDRGIVDEDVDPAELGERPGGQRLDFDLFPDVDAYEDCPKVAGLARNGLGLLGSAR
jgi:hypothetical protein